MTPRVLPHLAVFLLAASSMATTGCTGQKELIASHEAELDSVYAVTADLRAEIRMLRDSLQFYDDIDSGQYDRDRRLLVQQIERLQYDVGVCLDGGQTVRMLLVEDLFEPASALLTDAGREMLAEVAEGLRREHDGRLVRIEGHSDSTPIGASLLDRYPSNWELSADRAAAVVRFLVDVEGLPERQVELAAFGSSRPIAVESSAAGRSRNRRIRVAVMPE